jgi:hypothetical protein
MKTMKQNKVYFAPVTTIVALHGVRNVMQEEGGDIGLVSSFYHNGGNAPARVPARKLYI